jgi:hypothetical protein
MSTAREAWLLGGLLVWACGGGADDAAVDTTAAGSGGQAAAGAAGQPSGGASGGAAAGSGGAVAGSGGSAGSGGGVAGSGGAQQDASTPDACVPQSFELLALSQPGGTTTCPHAWPAELAGESVGWCTRVTVELVYSDSTTHLGYAGSANCTGGGWYLVDDTLHLCPDTCAALGGAAVVVHYACSIPPC